MTSRELAAYGIIVLVLAAFLIGWRIAARRRRSERRDANARIHLMGDDRPKRNGGT